MNDPTALLDWTARTRAKFSRHMRNSTALLDHISNSNILQRGASNGFDIAGMSGSIPELAVFSGLHTDIGAASQLGCPGFGEDGASRSGLSSPDSGPGFDIVGGVSAPEFIVSSFAFGAGAQGGPGGSTAARDRGSASKLVHAEGSDQTFNPYVLGFGVMPRPAHTEPGQSFAPDESTGGMSTAGSFAHSALPCLAPDPVHAASRDKRGAGP